MLEHIFLKIIDMSLTASIIIVVVMLARILLKRYPKYISYALWSVVLFRLICPISLDSAISIIPNTDTLFSENIIENNTYISDDRTQTALTFGESAGVETDLPNVTTVEVISNDNNALGKMSLQEKAIFVGKYIWLLGIGVMLIYSIAADYKIRRKMQTSVRLKGDIYINDEMISPFVMGVVRPKIYLPNCLSGKEQKYIIMHEQYHIKRFDHVIKMVSFLELSLHWFNPFVWVAFIFSGKDMEMSCDEAVIKAMGEGIRADYSASLLAIATGFKDRNRFLVAFGESDTKTRIKNIANMRTIKKGVRVIVILAVIGLSICLATNRTSSSGNEAFENEAFNNTLTQKEYAADVERIFFTKAYDNDGNIESFVIVGNNDDFYGDGMLYGYLQINIARDDGDFLIFSHRTYRTDDENELELVEEAEGCYKVNVDDDSEITFPSMVIEDYL